MQQQKQELKKLIYIYNASSGKKNAFLDVAHKLFSPSTYDCKLCAITFGTFQEKILWKKFRKSSKIPMEFLHKDEFLKAYASKFGFKTTYPVVLAETNYNLEFFIGTDELKVLASVNDLIELVENRLD
tara:strand:- start:2230 stop:2613 length:384 start_codon:yes stop_codon:yes gene_type:complete